MSLKRDEWLEMWSTLKLMEHDLAHFPIDRHSGPFLLRQQNDQIKKMLGNVRRIKDQVQSVIGQME